MLDLLIRDKYVFSDAALPNTIVFTGEEFELMDPIDDKDLAFYTGCDRYHLTGRNMEIPHYNVKNQGHMVAFGNKYLLNKFLVQHL